MFGLKFQETCRDFNSPVYKLCSLICHLNSKHNSHCIKLVPDDYDIHLSVYIINN